MNRRSFLKRSGLACAACAIPTIAIMKSEKPIKVTEGSDRLDWKGYLPVLLKTGEEVRVFCVGFSGKKSARPVRFRKSTYFRIGNGDGTFRKPEDGRYVMQDNLEQIAVEDLA